MNENPSPHRDVLRVHVHVLRVHGLDLACGLLWTSIVAVTLWYCRSRGVATSTLTVGLSAAGLFLAMTLPWNLRSRLTTQRCGLLLAAGASLVAGVASQLIVLIALGSTLILWAWLDMRLVPGQMRRVRRLLPLTLFVLPWIEMDFAFVSLALRQISAAASQGLLAALGLLQVRSDTIVQVAGQPISVTGDCDGRDTLQAMLLVGYASAHWFLGGRRPLWVWTPLLVVLALLANASRVLLMCLGALVLDLQRHGQRLHDVGGWLTVACMLALCIGVFRMLSRTGTAFAIHHEWPLPAFRMPEITVRRATLQQNLLWPLVFLCLLVGLGTSHRPMEVRAVAGTAERCGTTGRNGSGYMTSGVQRADREEPAGSLEARLRNSLAAAELSGRMVALTETDRRRLGAAQAVKFVVQAGGQTCLVTAIDGTRNRHAVHDPTYCWEVLEAARLPLPGGHARALRVAEDGKEKEILFWFSTGSNRHASPARYLVQTSLRRLTQGRIGREPILVVIESLDDQPINWFRFLDRCPALDRF